MAIKKGFRDAARNPQERAINLSKKRVRPEPPILFCRIYGPLTRLDTSSGHAEQEIHANR